jgi:hypothetical protein
MVWHELKLQFTLPAGSKELVKQWTLNKMAEQFHTFKKNLTDAYIKQGKMPKFTGDLEKLTDHWDDFVEYKCSDIGIQWVQRNKKMHRRKYITKSKGKVATSVQSLNGRRWSKICLLEVSYLRL